MYSEILIYAPCYTADLDVVQVLYNYFPQNSYILFYNN
jgi:hypothetical protein